MTKTANVELTEKQRESIFKELSHFNLFKDSAHVPVKGISDWPPAKEANEDKPKRARKKA